MKNLNLLLLILIPLFLSFEVESSPAQENFWEQTNGPYGGDVTALAINSNGHIFAGAGCAVFRSTDNGDSWTNVSSGLPGLQTRIAQIAINPDGHIFVATYGLYRSTDNGESWTEVKVDPYLTGTWPTLTINANGHIFVGAFRDIYRSTDNGESFTRFTAELMEDNIISLFINSAGHIFAGTYNKVYRSTDNGENWTDCSTGLYNDNVSSFAANSSGHLFVGITGFGTGPGVYRSTNNGDNWR